MEGLLAMEAMVNIAQRIQITAEPSVAVEEEEVAVGPSKLSLIRLRGWELYLLLVGNVVSSVPTLQGAAAATEGFI
jgi:hypothetical protein